MIFFNNLLQDSKDELIQLIAALDNDNRAKTIKALFTEVVRAVNNEMILNKHTVSEWSSLTISCSTFCRYFCFSEIAS